MSLFAELHLIRKGQALPFEYPLQYARSTLILAKQRNAASVSSSLQGRVLNHCSALNLKPPAGELNFADFIAKVYNIGIENPQLWIYAATHCLFFMEFDEYFDGACNTPDNVSRLSMELRALLRALSRHGLGGLRGDLDDWPTGVPGREAFRWLLKETEALRMGAGEMSHYCFLDYCLGIELEIVEWAPDMYQGNTTKWDIDRCVEIRKRSAGVLYLMVPLYVAKTWIRKEHVAACNDLLYDVAAIGGLANDVMWIKHSEENEMGIQTLKIASRSEVIQYHNDRVRCLRKAILDLDGDTRSFMEEVEVSIVGVLLWECNALRYDVNLHTVVDLHT